MIQHADAECIIEYARQGQTANVALHHMNIWHPARRIERSFNGVAEVNANHVPHAPFSGKLQMPAFPTASVKHDFFLEEFGLHWVEPTQQLVAILLIVLRELLPFPTEAGGDGSFLFIDFL